MAIKLLFHVVDNADKDFYVVAADVADAYEKFRVWRVPPGAGAPPYGGIAKSVSLAGELIPEN
jgi:hypothetical protein